jgi:putative DNA primase/helicase
MFAILLIMKVEISDYPFPPQPELTLAERFARDSAGSVAYRLDTFWHYSPDAGWAELPLETLLSGLVVTTENTSSGRRPRALLRAAAASLRARLAVPPEAWNTDPNLLPCANGLLDLTTGARRNDPATASDHYLRTCAASYAPPDTPAACPAWEAFLQSTVPNEAEFLQEFAGLSLTFDDRFETAVWLHGPPGSGKSTFVRGLEIMLGERAVGLNLSALAGRQYTPAYFFGRSLLISVEQPVADFKYDHLINALLSGEPVPVRAPRERGESAAATFRVPAKWIWALTALPRVAYAGSGLFRRARLIRFPPRAEADRDPNLKAQLAQEAPGILRWALAGLSRLRARGRFNPPATVRAADAHFHLANDLIAQFIGDCTVRNPSSRTQAADLYKVYLTWCQHNGQPPQSKNAMAIELERFGFVRRRSGGLAYWHGLAIGELPWPEVLTKEQKAFNESLGF